LKKEGSQKQSVFFLVGATLIANDKRGGKNADESKKSRSGMLTIILGKRGKKVGKKNGFLGKLSSQVVIEVKSQKRKKKEEGRGGGGGNTKSVQGLATNPQTPGRRVVFFRGRRGKTATEKCCFKEKGSR